MPFSIWIRIRINTRYRLAKCDHIWIQNSSRISRFVAGLYSGSLFSKTKWLSKYPVGACDRVGRLRFSPSLFGSLANYRITSIRFDLPEMTELPNRGNRTNKQTAYEIDYSLTGKPRCIGLRNCFKQSHP